MLMIGSGESMMVYGLAKDFTVSQRLWKGALIGLFVSLIGMSIQIATNYYQSGFGDDECIKKNTTRTLRRIIDDNIKTIRLIALTNTSNIGQIDHITNHCKSDITFSKVGDTYKIDNLTIFYNTKRLDSDKIYIYLDSMSVTSINYEIKSWKSDN